MRLRVAVLKEGINGLADGASLFGIINLNTVHAHAYMPSEALGCLVEIFVMEEHGTIIRTWIVNLISIVNSIDHELERLAYTIRRDNAFQLNGISFLPVEFFRR